MNSIHIRGFKCFVDTNFSLGKLTVLAGVNGAGKTSLLHAIGVLHQTLCETNSLDDLVLNGAIINMGRAYDVLNKLNSKSEILFEIEHEGKLVPLVYTTESRDSFTIQRCAKTGSELPPSFLKMIRHAEYISADRQGPKDMHSLEDSFAYERSVGVRGERAVSALSSKENVEVIEGLRKPGTPLLPRQLEAHMADLFDNFKLEFSSVPGTNIATLSLANDNAVGFVRPQNIGFGLSYTLPIYVACLSATSGGLILIENPEAHLHPKAQSQIGAFLAQAASAGMQIIIETHSDHLMNGIRKAVKHGILPAKDVAIHFFAGLDTEGHPQIQSPRLSADGSLSMWPDNFFDQFDKDLADLVDW